MIKTFKVSAEDIQSGEVGNNYRCPIACAARRTLRLEYVWVDGESMFCGARLNDDNIIGARLPLEAKLFIESFDSKLPVEPFEFDMEFDHEDSSLK